MNIYDMNIPKEEREKDYSVKEIEELSTEQYVRLIFVRACGNGNADWVKRVKDFMKEEKYECGEWEPEYRNINGAVWQVTMMA
jgi:hypothetical protein